jgi:GNAT superfamily N-acetyltransferase
MLSDAQLLDLSDKNLAEAQREHARFLSPHSIEERDGLLLSAAGVTFPAAPFNAVSTTGDQTPPPERVLEQARAFFRAHDRGFGVMVAEHRDQELKAYCDEQDLPHFGNSPGMVLAAPVDAPTLPAGATMKTVASIDDAKQFVHVAAHAFEAIGLPVAVAKELLSQPAAWLEPHWHVRLIVENENPVAGAMVLMSHGIAGIYWVATLAESRGRGYGEAVTRAISNDAFERGAVAVVLQASNFGEPVYLRIGFKEITRYHWYLVAE